MEWQQFVMNLEALNPASVEEILLHVFTHGFYHRGQIASLVNALGGAPERDPSTEVTKIEVVKVDRPKPKAKPDTPPPPPPTREPQARYCRAFSGSNPMRSASSPNSSYILRFSGLPRTSKAL